MHHNWDVFYIVHGLECVFGITTNTCSLNYQNIFGLFERKYSLFEIQFTEPDD